MQEYITLILWILLAGWGIQVMTRAIARNQVLIDVAERHNSDKSVIGHLKNVLFMYRTRLWLIVNNMGIGIFSMLTVFGLFNQPAIMSVYIAISLLVNEASFIYLTYRDERLLNKHQKAAESE